MTASFSYSGFQKWIDDMGLIDMVFSGYPYTWSNKRAGQANIQIQLDRGLINADWRTLFPKASITHLTSLASDHTPLLLQTNPLDPSRQRPFRFEDMWARDSESFDIVQRLWNLNVHCSSLYKLSISLKQTKNDLKIWNTEHFGHVKT